MMIPVPIRKHQFHWRHPALSFFFHSNNTTNFIFLFAFLLFLTSYTIFNFFKRKILVYFLLKLPEETHYSIHEQWIKTRDTCNPWRFSAAMGFMQKGRGGTPPSQVEQLFADAFNECFSCHQMRKMWKIFLDLLFHITRFECVVIIQYSLPANAIYVQQINYGR